MCHTPHRAYRTTLLWNHTLANNVYRWSKVATVGGTSYPSIASNWTGSARFCLSCHDGSVAIGDIAWFNGQSWTGRPIDHNNHNGDNVQIGTVSGDLTRNHPISFPYPLAGVPSTYNGVTTAPGAIASGFRPDPTAAGIRLFKQVGGLVTAGTAGGCDRHRVLVLPRPAQQPVCGAGRLLPARLDRRPRRQLHLPQVPPGDGRLQGQSVPGPAPPEMMGMVTPWSTRGAVVVAILCAGVFAQACSPSSRSRLVRTLFDGVPPPGAQVDPSRARRQQPEPVLATSRQAAVIPSPVAAPLVIPPAPFEAYKTWEQMLTALPTDAGGGVDWVQAFNTHLVTPRLLHSTDSLVERPLTLDTLMDVAVDDPRVPALDLDIHITPSANASFEGGEFYQVKFPHSSHTAWLGCSSCHPGVQSGEDRNARHPAGQLVRTLPRPRVVRGRHELQSVSRQSRSTDARGARRGAGRRS